MLIDDFFTFLEQNEIGYTTNDQSVIMAEAPCCGGHNKVYLFKEDETDQGKPLFGKCMKCDTTWNSYTYLSELGYDLKTLDLLHGKTDLKDMELAVVSSFDLFKAPKKEKVETPTFDVNLYYPLQEIPDHEASLYAIKRGWVPEHAKNILIDMLASAVVFVVRDSTGKVLGYQKRFLIPPRPEMKVKSAKGFKKTQHIMEFPNSGDIMVCEGPFTALSAWHYGFYAICTFGAGVSEKQLSLIAEIARKTKKRVGVAFDLDAAGRKGYRTVRMGMYWEKIPTFHIRPEVGNDLNDSWQAKKGFIVLPSKDDDITIPELDVPEEGFL